MARTQKNKATEHHLGILKAKLAKYRAELSAPSSGRSAQEGFSVRKSGDARVVLIGFPSVGKSTLVSALTSVFSRQADTEFTTLGCVAGRLEYEGASIQMLDLPGIIEGASNNRGRGKQVIATARTADLIMMVLDARRPSDRPILERELSEMGIRLGRKKPDVTINKGGSGIDLLVAVDGGLTKLSEETIKGILKEYKMGECQITIREDIDDEELIDVISGRAVYIECLYCYNKIDELSYGEFLALMGECPGKHEGHGVSSHGAGPDSTAPGGSVGPHGPVADSPAHGRPVPISCRRSWNLDRLKHEIWIRLGLIRVYTRRRGVQPDFIQPVIMTGGSTVRDLCTRLHASLDSSFRHGFVWGRSAKHFPQKVGLGHVLADEDVVQIVTATGA